MVTMHVCAADGHEIVRPLRFGGGLEGCRLAVAGVVADLDRLVANADGGFLAIAGGLRQVGRLFDDITAAATTAAATASSAEVSRLLDEFEGTLAEMEHFLEGRRVGAVDAVARLQAIALELDLVMKLIRQFHSRVGTLRLIRTLTSIQSASLGSASRGFGTVAGNIDSLSKQVRDRSTSVLALLTELQRLLDRALQVGLDLERRQSSLGRDAVASIRGSLDALSGLQRACGDVADGMAQISAGGSREVGDTIVSLQYHDITRQQLDHVRAALASLLTGLNETPSSLSGFGEQGRLLQETGQVCRLQAAQAANSAEELDQAHGSVRVNLQQLARKAASTSARTGEIFGSGDIVEAGALGGIAADLARISDLFAESLGHGRELDSLVSRVSREMEQVGSFLGDIEYIGSEMKLIALNAIIKAAQMGPEGAAMGVLAEAVRAESEEVCRQTALIGAAIVSIVGLVSAGGGAECSADGSAFDAISRRLLRTSESLEQLNIQVTERLRAGRDGAETLTAEVQRLLSALDGDSLVRELRTRVVGPLQGLGMLARGTTGENPHMSQDRYTMSSERRVHERIAAGPPPRHHEPSQGAGDLGCNVELF